MNKAKEIVGTRLFKIALVLFIAAILMTVHLLPGSSDWKRYPYTSPNGKLLLPEHDGSQNGTSYEWWYMNFHANYSNGMPFSFQLLIFENQYISISLVDLEEEKYYTRMVRTPAQSILFEREELGITFNGDGFQVSLNQMEGRPFEYTYQAKHVLYHETEAALFDLDVNMVASKRPYVIDNTVFDSTAEKVNILEYYIPVDVVGSISIDGIEHKIRGMGCYNHFWSFTSIYDMKWEWIHAITNQGHDMFIWPIASFSGNQAIKHFYISYPDGTEAVTNNIQVEYMGFWSQNDFDDSKFSMGWYVNCTNLDIYLRIEPPFPKQLRGDGLLEAACYLTGSIGGREVSGYAFAEANYLHSDA